MDANGNKIHHIETVIRDNQTDPALLAAGVAAYDTTYVVYSNYRAYVWSTTTRR